MDGFEPFLHENARGGLSTCGVLRCVPVTVVIGAIHCQLITDTRLVKLIRYPTKVTVKIIIRDFVLKALRCTLKPLMYPSSAELAYTSYRRALGPAKYLSEVTFDHIAT